VRVLITGAGGMVGGAIESHLRDSHDVLGLRRSDVDLLDAPVVAATIARLAPDVVIHAAGRVGGIEANRSANSAFLVENTLLGFNVVRAARDAGVARLLNLSSSCVYPKDRELLHEDDLLTGPLEPTNQGYALAKIGVAYLCKALSDEDATAQYKTFVPCNLYGPGDNYDPQRAHMLPSAIRKVEAALAGETPHVSIWGDGTVRREFMFVGDLATAAGHALTDWDAVPDVVNIGVGRDHTISEYYTAVAAVMGYEGRFVYEPDRPVGMRRKLLDVGRAHAWGWSATTTLEEGIERAVRDYRSRR
jgi:GDP-L-fucose synthase